MSDRLREIIGFNAAFLAPLATIGIALLGYARGAFFSAQILAAPLSLGLISLLVFAVAYRPSGFSTPEDYVDLSRGARYGTLAGFVSSLPLLVLSSIFGQSDVGMSILFVTLGSVWLPSACAAGAYGYLLANDRRYEQFPSNAVGTTHEGTATLFLALFLGKYKLIRNRFKEFFLVIALAGLYSYGWLVLSLAGGWPVTSIGMITGALVPLVAYATFIFRVQPDGRRKVSHLLVGP